MRERRAHEAVRRLLVPDQRCSELRQDQARERDEEEREVAETYLTDVPAREAESGCSGQHAAHEDHGPSHVDEERDIEVARA